MLECFQHWRMGAAKMKDDKKQMKTYQERVKMEGSKVGKE